MMTVLRWSLCVIVYLASVDAAWSGADEALRALEEQRLGWLVKGDWAAYDALLGDEFIYNHAGGGTLPKAAYLQALHAGRTKVNQATAQGVTVRLYGNTALVTGTTHMQVTQQSKDKTQHSRYLHVWHNQGDGWKLVARQATYLPATPPTESSLRP